MMKRIVMAMLLILITFSGFAQDSHPVSWKIASEKIGQSTYRIKLKAAIKAPYHIYPQQAFDAGLGMPTEIFFEEDDNVEFVGKIEEKGVEQASGESVAYYAKEVTFTQELKLISARKTTLSFTIKYMACTNEMCLPPSSKKFTLALNDQGKGAGAPENEKPAVVSKMPKASFTYEDFSMPDVDGKIVSSRDITSQSKYTFIDFWASWCIPCRAQGRELIPIYNKYNPQGFRVIGVSLDTDAKAWKKAIRADEYTWTNLSDGKGFQSSMSEKYAITAIPRNILVDDKGIIVATDIHGKELETKLEELFRSR